MAGKPGKRCVVNLSLTEAEAWAIAGMIESKARARAVEKVFKELAKTREPRPLRGFRNYPDGNGSKTPAKLP